VALARLRLERPLVLALADRLVLRSYSPAVTIGGARVLDALPPRRLGVDRRGRLARLVRADAAQALALYAEEAGWCGADIGELAARTAIPRPHAVEQLTDRPGLVVLGRDPGVALSRAAVDALAGQVVSALERYHRDNRLREAMSLEELRGRVFAHAPEGLAEHVLEELRCAGRVRLAADGVALASHRPTFSSEEEAARGGILAALRQAGLSGLAPEGVKRAARNDARVGERVARALVAAGEAHRAPGGTLIHRDHVESLSADVRERWPAGSLVDIGIFKEMTGLTRKHAIPLLELLDALRVTRRAGTARIVLSKGEGPSKSLGVGSRETTE
jgi:selenocysteine-specific elongation factor